MPASVPPAIVTFAFDPVLRVGPLGIRWETVGIAAAILLTLVAGALIGGRTPRAGGGRLRRDDLLFVALGATPGAVVGGRLGYVLLHLDYFASRPQAIMDPATGGLELSLAVAGGVLTGLVVASLLDGSGRRWAHAAAVPLLAGLALGKAAMALGGSGQGAPSDAAWASAYLGGGPWTSVAPGLPSHPAQLYEALGYVLALLVVGVAVALGLGARRDGRLLALAVALVALVRFAVAFTWRDGTILGPFRVEHLLAIGPLLLGLATWIVFARASAPGDRIAQDGEPSWPDPSIADRWRARTNER